MEHAVEVEILDFTGFDLTIVHVLININIGKMSKNNASKYIKKIKATLPLCKMLDEQSITYSLIPCSSDGLHDITVDIEYDSDNR